MKKFIIVLVLVAATCAGIVWHIRVDRRRFQNNFELIRPGMTGEDVRAALGPPKQTKSPCLAHRPDCQEDLVYELPLDFAGFWTVSLNKSGNVVDKFRWDSP